MKSNIDKCKVLHIGNNNNHTKQTINISELSKVSHEKDLGITITRNLKPSKDCSGVVKTANKLVGFIRRTFEYRSEKKLSLHYLMHLYALIQNTALSSGHYTMKQILISWREYTEKLLQ